MIHISKSSIKSIEDKTKLKFNLSQIKFSRADFKRKIILPKKMNKYLAELIGIMIGDGSVGIYKGKMSNGKKYVHYEIKFAGHFKDDYSYYKNHVVSLFKRLFNCELKLRKHNKFKGNMLDVTTNSKAIVMFISRILKIPIGNKVSIIEIPKYIKSPQII